MWNDWCSALSWHFNQRRETPFWRTLIFFLRLHCIAAKRSIDHVCPLSFWARRKNVLDSRSCKEIWLSTLILYSLPLIYNPHGITFLISVLVMFTGRLCCGFGDLTKWSSLCVIASPHEVWPELRTFGIALVNLAHFTHLVLIRGTTRVFLPLNVTINLALSQLEITIPHKLVWLKSHHTQRARPVPRSQSA